MTVMIRPLAVPASSVRVRSAMGGWPWRWSKMISQPSV